MIRRATPVPNDVFVIANIAQRLRATVRKDFGREIVNSGHLDDEILERAVYDFENPPKNVSTEYRWKVEF